MNKFTAFLYNNFFRNKKVKYLFVGGSAFVIEYTFFVILNFTTHFLVLANVISFLAGFSYSFYLHLRWTFKGNHKHAIRTQFVSYGLLAVINLTLTSIIISYLVQHLQVQPLIAKVLCMVLVVTWNFILLNNIVFKAHVKGDE